MSTKNAMTRTKLEKKFTPVRLAQIENNVWCGTCKETRKIVSYENSITINDLGDTVLHGQCAVCKGKVARYLETGDTTNKA